MAMARLCCWFYSPWGLLGEDPVFVEPNRPYNKWTVVHNHGWLSAWGLPTTGNAQTLRERVAAYLQQEGGPPEAKEPDGGSVQNVHLLACECT